MAMNIGFLPRFGRNERPSLEPPLGWPFRFGLPPREGDLDGGAPPHVHRGKTHTIRSKLTINFGVGRGALGACNNYLRSTRNENWENRCCGRAATQCAASEIDRPHPRENPRELLSACLVEGSVS